MHGNVYKSLQSAGIGAALSAATISKGELDRLWEFRILGSDTPRALVRATFFVVRLHACLRGGEEHRSLRFSNFSRNSSPERRVYVENYSKNRQGGLSHLAHKEVPIYQCSDAGNRCPVKILDEYHARVPPDAILEDAVFYLRPLPGTPVANIWFAKQPIGSTC